MSWFDTAARRAARNSDNQAHRRPSRRNVLAGSAAAAGPAWAAPSLVGAAPAFAGISTCPSANLCPPGTATSASVCCAGRVGTSNGDYTCTSTSTGYVCVAPGDVGGTCLNNGQGTGGCHQTLSIGTDVHCNGSRPNICGGRGAKCAKNTDCVSGVCQGGSGSPSSGTCS